MAMFEGKSLLVAFVVGALAVASCSSDVTESEEYQALIGDIDELASSQADTERQLAEVEGQLASAEERSSDVESQVGDLESQVGDLESQVVDLEAGLSVEAEESPQDEQPTDLEGAVTIFGDGEISCPDHRADDESLPVGTIVYQPSEGEIRVIVTLTAAAPNWVYGVELWSDESCNSDTAFGFVDETIETDETGAGELDFVVSGLEPGTYRLNVNVSSGGDVPEDLRHREMGTTQFTSVVVP
jgi:outer membrane murein-binding lipoprotein Lpp